MLYYHDQPNATVIAAPDEPTVVEKSCGRGGIIWSVSAGFEVTRADNFYDRQLKRWRYDVRYFRKEQYTDRDSREDAIRHFKNACYPQLPLISAADYLRLNSMYDNQARANKTP